MKRPSSKLVLIFMRLLLWLFIISLLLDRVPLGRLASLRQHLVSCEIFGGVIQYTEGLLGSLRLQRWVSDEGAILGLVMCHDLGWRADKHFLGNFLVHGQIIFILHDRAFMASCILDCMMLGYMAGSGLQLHLRRHLMARK